jgi:hypothetical protein
MTPNPTHPHTGLFPLPTSFQLQRPRHRPGRHLHHNPIDTSPHSSYGNSILHKHHHTTRVYFQNVKGLTYSSGCEDYRYYFSSLQSYDIDLAGLAETNTCWTHPHLQQDLCHCLRRFYPQHKITFASPDPGIDRCAPSESFQAGGSFTLATGISASRVQGTPLRDETGLGRWSGLRFTGQSNEQFCLLTAYRVCNGSAARPPIGSSYLQEYEYF